MKFYKYSLIAALALSGALCACDDDVEYTPGSKVDTDQVYLPDNISSDIAIPENATTIALSVNRVKTDDALTVGIASQITDAEGNAVSGVFTVPTEVSFAAGESVAALDVAVDFSKVVLEEEYTLTISLQSDELTPYGASKREYKLIYAPWSEWDYVPGEVGVYNMQVFTSGAFEVPVLYKYSMANPNLSVYAVCDLFYVGSNSKVPYINFTYTMDKSVTVEIDGKEYPRVSMDMLIYQDYLMTDVRTWLVDLAGVAEDRVDAVIEANGWKQSYYNPETGTFAVFLVLTKPEIAAEGRYYEAAYDYLQLPGYKNYEIAFEYTGNYVDATGTEYAIVNAFKSDDVTSFVADIFNGKLDEAGVSAAIEDIKSNDELESYTSSTNLVFVCEENGPYTVVGIGYDENGEEVCKTSYSFNYSTVQGGNPWETIGYCEYTDGIINSMFNAGGETWDVEVQENTETPGLYRLVNPYKEWADAYQAGYSNGNYYMIVHAENPNQVYLEMTDLGVALNSKGSIYVWSYADLLMQNGRTPAQVAAAGLFGTMNDGVITFPTGSLLATYSSSVEAGSWSYANVDPDNPAFTDNTIKFDPTWGTGTFCIDFGSAASAPSKSPAASHKSVSAKEYKVEGIKAAAKKASLKRTIDAQTLQDYRKNNPRQLKY